MKNFVVILISLLVLSTSLQEFFIVTHFYFNRKSLTEKFCINKKNIELNCHASCFLTKEINSSEKSNKNRFDNLKLEISQFTVPESSYYLIALNNNVEIEHHFSYEAPHMHEFNSLYFRPPKG